MSEAGAFLPDIRSGPEERGGPAITPCLWFDNNAEEAVGFYVGVFPASRIVDVTRFGEAGPGPAGSVMALTFELAGQRFMALNGGPAFTFTPAISLFVGCRTQDEVDSFWEALLAGGEAQQCGWLKDRYGLSWQIVPTVLLEMLRDDDPQKAGRVMGAMLQMVKLDITALERAYEG